MAGQIVDLKPVNAHAGRPAPARLSDRTPGVEEPPEGGQAPEPLARRVRRPQTLVSFGLAIFIVVFFFRQLEVDPGAVWGNVKQTNLLLYASAFLVFYGAFVLRAARWRIMLARVGVDGEHGYPVPGLGGTIEIFLLSWFTNCVVPAKLGDAYRGYLLKRACGAPFSTSLGTILAERLTDLAVLFLIMSGAAVVAFHGDLPGQASQMVLIGSGLLAIGALGVAAFWFGRGPILRRTPARLQAQFGRLHDGLFACLRRPGPFVAFSVAIWTLEGVRLFFVAKALGVGLSPETALFVALMGSLLTTVPITPAGLGVVEVATLKVLELVDVQTDLAGSIALLDRVVGYWSVIAVGLVLYLVRIRRDLAGERATASAGADAPAD